MAQAFPLRYACSDIGSFRILVIEHNKMPKLSLCMIKFIGYR